MARINIERPHSLGLAAAREKAQGLAERLAQEYQVRYRWEGDCLEFARFIERHACGLRVNAGRAVLASGARLREGGMSQPTRGRAEREIGRACAMHEGAQGFVVECGASLMCIDCNAEEREREERHTDGQRGEARHHGERSKLSKSCVRMLSATSTAIETTTTDVVVERPTPSVPPRVVMP